MKWMNIQHKHGIQLASRHRAIRQYCRFDSNNPYTILGLPANASVKDIREAYIKLSKEFHPDVNKSKNSQEKFKKVCAAYEVLKTEEKRKNYLLQNANKAEFPRSKPNPNQSYYRETYNPRYSRMEKEYEEFMREQQRQRQNFFKENYGRSQQQHEYWRHKRRAQRRQPDNYEVDMDFSFIFSIFITLLAFQMAVVTSKFLLFREIKTKNERFFYGHKDKDKDTVLDKEDIT